MRKLSYLVAVLCLFMAAGSCKKDDQVSRVVTLPYIELNGNKFISIRVGGSVTDEGASVVNDVAANGGAALTAVSSTLDPSTPGLYYMLYEAETRNGYHLYAARYIAVTDYPDDADLSGVYERTSNGIQVNLSRKARGLYQVDDMGGAGLPDALYFAVINDSTIDAGPQFSESRQTEIYADNSGLTLGPTDTSFRYVIHSPGYGTALRTFVKVP